MCENVWQATRQFARPLFKFRGAGGGVYSNRPAMVDGDKGLA